VRLQRNGRASLAPSGRLLVRREALRDLQRFRRFRWGLILGPFVATAVMSIELRSSADVILQACRDSAVLITFASALFSLLGYPACPRCGRSFEAKHWGRNSVHTAFNPFTRRCRRCGLRLDAESDSVPSGDVAPPDTMRALWFTTPVGTVPDDVPDEHVQPPAIV
jgi:hypothetical protein